MMFSDADLLGVPLRVIVSPRNMEESVVELVSRDKAIQEKVPIDGIVARLEELIAQMM